MTIPEAIAESQAFWVRLKRSVASGGIAYAEIQGLDIFEFFQILTEINRKEK